MPRYTCPHLLKSPAANDFDYPTTVPFPNRTMRLVDGIDLFAPEGGPEQLGFIRSTTPHYDPAAWFFKAHFLKTPSGPARLGWSHIIQLPRKVEPSAVGG